MTATLGYARVSTDRQSLSAQEDALLAAGTHRVFVDKRSGARGDREGLAALLDCARPGDTVVVTALDRLGCSLTGVIRTIEALTTAGIALRSLREGIDSMTPTGRVLIGMLAYLAEYDRSLTAERAASARRVARARKQQTGRPTVLDAEQAQQIRELRTQGEPVAELVSAFGVSRATIYRALRTADRRDAAARS